MFYRGTALCALALLFVTSGFAARAQSAVAQVPKESAAARPLQQQGEATQSVPAPQDSQKPTPAAPQSPAAVATAPADKPPAAPTSSAVASPPAQAPIGKIPQAAAPSAAAPTSKEPIATVGKDRPAKMLPAPRSLAAEQSSHVPAWLKAHVGVGEGQIAQVVLQRARALYQQKVSEGAVKNPCYFAMDATRPSDLGGGKLGRRFYVICEAKRMFDAVPAGHGSGRHLKGIANFRNGRKCAKNFGNALDSKLTTGGAYLTSEVRTSFEGYYRLSAGKDVALSRSFIQFDGEGDTANARQRAIGGHAAVLLRGVCLRKDPDSPHANDKGYVRFGKLVNYAGGRSNGCTSWSRPDARKIVAMVKHDPTTLYIYPDAADIEAVARSVKDGRAIKHAGLYWNESCLKEIHSPKFWSKEILEPLLARYRKEHPPSPPQPLPLCKGPVVSAKK